MTDATHSVWTYAEELLHPRANNGKFAHIPGGGKADVKLRSGAVISGVHFDDKGNGHVYLGGGLHTHFHPNGTSTTHTHSDTSDPTDKGNYPHFHSESSGSMAVATAVVKPMPDAPDPSAPPAPKIPEPGETHTYSSSTGNSLEVYDDGSGLITTTAGSSWTLKPDEVQEAVSSPGVWKPTPDVKPVPLVDAWAAANAKPSAPAVPAAPAAPAAPPGFAYNHNDLTAKTSVSDVKPGDIWVKDDQQAYLITAIEDGGSGETQIIGVPIADDSGVPVKQEPEPLAYVDSADSDYELDVISAASPDYPISDDELSELGLSAPAFTPPPEVGPGEVHLPETDASVKVGHYAAIPNVQEGFTVHADGSAQWDGGGIMLPSYIPVATAGKQPEPADPNIGMSIEDPQASAESYTPPPFAPPTPDTDIYKHPAGGTIYVHLDGSLEAWDKHGKKKSTSATVDKLEAGHGKWSYVGHDQWDQPLGGAEPSAPADSTPSSAPPPKPGSRPSATASPPLTAGTGKSAYAGAWQMPDGSVLKVGDEGYGTWFNADGTSKGVASVPPTAMQETIMSLPSGYDYKPGIDAFDVDFKPTADATNAAKPGEKWAGPVVDAETDKPTDSTWTLKVNPDGSGLVTYSPSGASQQVAADSVQSMVSTLPGAHKISEPRAPKTVLTYPATGATITVNPDGSGEFVSGINGSTTHLSPEGLATDLATGDYVDSDGKPVLLPPPKYAPNGAPVGVWFYPDTEASLSVAPDGSSTFMSGITGQESSMTPDETYMEFENGGYVDEDGNPIHIDPNGHGLAPDEPAVAPAPVAAPDEPPVAPNGAVVGIYTQSDSSAPTLTVHPGGSGTYTYADNSPPLNVLPSAVAAAIDGGGYFDQLGFAAYLHDVTPASEPPIAATVPKTAPKELVDLASMLDFPADYAYPIVAGAPPATKLDEPKQIGTSLRGGDVILNDTGAEVAVVKVKKDADGMKVWWLSPGGATGTFQVPPGGTVTAIARTPHPQVTAQAKKAKAQLQSGEWKLDDDAADATPVPAAPIPHAPPGEYVGPTGDQFLTVGADGTGLLHGENLTTQTISADGVHVILAVPEGADPANAWKPKPPTITPSGPVLAANTKAAAKPKQWSSKMLVPGATVLLPKGGSMVVTGKVYEPGAGYVLHGTPSADAHPDYLTATDAKLPWSEVSVQGGVMFVPKVALNKTNAYAAWTPTPAASPITDVPPVQSVSAQAAGELPPPPTLDTVGWTKIGGQAGSNFGGLFATPAGGEFYVKKPKDQLHVENEVLAARLYTAAGVKVPNVSFANLEPGMLGGAGKGLASEIVSGKKNLQEAIKDPAFKAKVQDGFAVHAWLGNWDAAGMGYDNIITGPGGEPVMVDGGGSMLFRAMGDLKGSDWGPKVTEDASLLSLQNNTQAAKTFGPMTKAQIKASVAKHIAPMTPDKIDALVKTTMTSDPEVAAVLADTLKARRLDLLKRYDVVAPENVVSKAPVVNVPGGVLHPVVGPVQSEQVSLGGKDLWFHTTEVGATKIPVGAVLFLTSKPEAPWVVTKHAENPSTHKMGLWGKKNGVGPEEWLLQEVTSSEGERQVRVQIAPPAGWAPPPPPPPAVPGVKLTPRKNKAGSAGSVAGVSSKLSSLNNSLNTKTSLSNAFKRATPEMLAQLSAVGLGSASSFANHFGTLSANWNGSCASHINVLAMHHAVAMEFSLEGTAPWPNELKNMTTKVQVQNYYGKWGKAYQAAARLIWMETQEQLKAKGIDYVGVSRGFGFVKPDSSGAGQGTISNFGGGNVPAPPWAWKNTTTNGVVLRPLSSFSFTSPIGNTRIEAEVPRELIFSLSATGFGTSGETELVILGAPAQWKVAGAVAPGGASFTPEKYYAKFPEWTPGSYQLKKDDVDYPNVYPCAETEDYHKAFLPWPFVDEDGDDVDTYAEFTDLFPSVDPVGLLDLPVGLQMPAKLRAELEAMRADDDYEPEPPMVGEDDMRYPPLDPSRIFDETGTPATDESKALAAGSPQPNFSTGVMVCLRPTGAAHTTLAGSATEEAAADLHVTLAYLGNLKDLTGGDVARLRAGVAGFASVHSPITGEIAGVARFTDTGAGVPTVALVDSPELPDFRAELVEALDGLPISTTHGFTPHVTLGYDVEGDPGGAVGGTKLTFSKICLVLGDDEEDFDLTAPQTKAYDPEDVDEWVGLI